MLWDSTLMPRIATLGLFSSENCRNLESLISWPEFEIFRQIQVSYPRG
jgi:hypothetical protein